MRTTGRAGAWGRAWTASAFSMRAANAAFARGGMFQHFLG